MVAVLAAGARAGGPKYPCDVRVCRDEAFSGSLIHFLKQRQAECSWWIKSGAKDGLYRRDNSCGSNERQSYQAA
jgi:hypothetical protein